MWAQLVELLFCKGLQGEGEVAVCAEVTGGLSGVSEVFYILIHSGLRVIMGTYLVFSMIRGSPVRNVAFGEVMPRLSRRAVQRSVEFAQKLRLPFLVG